MSAPDNTFYVAPEQLCAGLYIHLDLSWMDHPFPFSSFKIKNDEQLATIRQLGLSRIRVEPGKSACKPLPPVSRDEKASMPAVAVVPADSEATKEKKQRIEQLNRIKRDIAEVEKEFQQAAETVRNIARNIYSRPQEVRQEAEKLVGKMVESILSRGDVMVHAMSEKLGEDAYFHALNVTVLSLILAKALGMGEEESRHLGVGAMFHDIGKLEIPPKILMKTDPLTKSEQSFFEMHCEYGLDIANKTGLPEQAAEIVMQHHEYIDGSGYPGKLKAENISPLSKIVSIVNVYDNLCNPHNPAEALTPHEALSQMFAVKRNKFDAAALKAFIHCLGVYPPGSIVQLSNEMLGMVISVNSAMPLKPNVLVYDPGIPKDEAVIISLEREADLNISKSLRPGQLPREIYQYLNPRKRVTYYFDPKKQNEHA
ncbi:MAG: metal-dependent phosphohydrolase [Nitrosomonadales bacterium]|nr:MAG: metal-dependent phosphohydrolase [Nitrosomonadales bacterium]